MLITQLRHHVEISLLEGRNDHAWRQGRGLKVVAKKYIHLGFATVSRFVSWQLQFNIFTRQIILGLL